MTVDYSDRYASSTRSSHLFPKTEKSINDAVTEMFDTFNVLPSLRIPPVTHLENINKTSKQYHAARRDFSLEFKKNANLEIKTQVSFNPHLSNTTSLRDMNDKKKKDSITGPEIAFFESNITRSYRHMFIKTAEKAHFLNDRIDQLCRLIDPTNQNELFSDNTDASDTSHKKIWSHPGLQGPDIISTYGRLCSDAEEVKWNDRSVILETSRSLGSGAKVRINLKDLPGYSCFPGQIIAFEGIPTFDGFYPKSILALPRLDRAVTQLKELADRQSSQHILRFLVANGPFGFYNSEIKSFDFSSFDRLLAYASNYDGQTVLLLLGPFFESEMLSAYYTNSGASESPEELFTREISGRLNALPLNQTFHVLIMPSLKDPFHDYVYPQGPFSRELLQLHDSIILLSNPCHFFINEFVVSASTVDILFDLSCNEISKSANVELSSGQDRMSRLVKHVLSQRSFYPMFPPSGNVNIEWGHFSATEFNVQPDLLILPSQLRYFAKNVDDVIVVNPSSFLRGSTTGTFAEIFVHPLKLNPGATMEENTQYVPNLLEDRTRVDIHQFINAN